MALTSMFSPGRALGLETALVAAAGTLLLQACDGTTDTHLAPARLVQ